MASFQCKLLNLLLKLAVKPAFNQLAQAESKNKQTSLIKQIRKKMKRFVFKPPRAAEVQNVKIDHLHAVWVGEKNKNYQHYILYLHGGGYAIGSSKHYLDLGFRLAKASNARVLLVDYRLAPENPFPNALEDSLTAYYWLLQNPIQPKQIFLAGDSAGGGLVLSTLVALRDKRDPLPAAGICFSPWTDLCFTGDSIRENDENDPYIVIPKQLSYLGRIDKQNPLVSPLYANLHGLPPLLIQVGRNEVLLDDSRNFAKKAKKAGVNVDLQVWEEVPHAWQFFAKYLPEGRQALEEAGKFIISSNLNQHP